MNHRWDVMDVLRGLTIIVMLLNLSPGSREFNYAWLVHAKWEGWTLIYMVAPAFLFCIGAVMPLSRRRRFEKGASRQALLGHVLWRSLVLIAIGLFLNLYLNFDWAHVRIPGVLQRIGLCYGLSGIFVLLTARRMASGALELKPGLLAVAAAFVLVSAWLLLYAVPVPGFGAPGFDQVGSWAVCACAAIDSPESKAARQQRCAIRTRSPEIMKLRYFLTLRPGVLFDAQEQETRHPRNVRVRQARIPDAWN